MSKMSLNLLSTPRQIVKDRITVRPKIKSNPEIVNLEKKTDIDLYDAMAKDLGYYKIGNRYIKKMFSY